MKKAVLCAQCGTKMRAGIKFCSKCGYRLRDAEAEAIAEAAQAEEAAANFLTEEEIAALAAPAESETTVVEEETSSAEEPSLNPVAEKHRASAEKSVAKLAAKGEADVARVTGLSAVRRQNTENLSRMEAARRDRTVAVAEARAAKKDSVAASKLAAMQIAEDRRLAKQRTEEDKRNFRANAGLAARDAARAAREGRKGIEARVLESRVADLREEGDRALAKKEGREIIRAEREAQASRGAAFREETKASRSRAKAMRAEDRREAKSRHEEEKLPVRERSAQNHLYERRVASDKAKLKQRVTAEERMQTLRLSDELKTARRLAAEREKATRSLLREESKISDRSNDEIKRTAEEKAFDNRLYAKKAAAERRTRKRREADIQRTAVKQASVRERETKRLGAIEYKAAATNLSAEAAEARRQAEVAAREMQLRREEEKLNEKNAVTEKRLIRLRAADKQKHAHVRASLRAKETRALGRAELRALKVTKSEEALETRRKTDEVKSQIVQKTYEDKLYAKKLAAQRRLIRLKAADTDKLQRAELQNEEKLHEVQMLEDSRASRMRTDETERAFRSQKNQDALYRRKKNADDKISGREHRLEVKGVDAASARDARIMTQKEKEQRKNLRLAQKYEKDAVRRAKKIARISGMPVSLVPALTGETAPSALLTAGGEAATGVPALRDPETLLASSYETNREQYLAYKKKKKKEVARLRYVEIGVRNDKKYFNSIYENGEVLVAKRTVRIARVQAILSFFLMAMVLLGSFLPIFTVERGVDVPEVVYDVILDGQGVISFESLLTDSQTDTASLSGYLKGLVSKFTSADILGSVQNGIASYITAVQETLAGDSLLVNLGQLVLFAFLALAVLLTPVLAFVNLLVALLRLVFRIFGKGVGITRVMQNLRVSYALLGFIVLPVLLFKEAVLGMGCQILLGSFLATIILQFVLNLFKKYVPCDRRFMSLVRLGGLVHLALLVVFMFLLSQSGVYDVSDCGTDATMRYVSFACLGLSYVSFALCAFSFANFGFELIGYTKCLVGNRDNNETPIATVIFGILGTVLGVLPRFLVGASIGNSLILAGLVILVLAAFTLILNLVKRIVAKRNNMIDPILDALREGYPLK